MRVRSILAAGGVGLLALSLAACGSASSSKTSTTALPLTTAATVPPTTVVTVPPTTPAEAVLPTYSQVVATYPLGTTACDFEATAHSATENTFESTGLALTPTGGSMPIVNNRAQIPCYGIKITIDAASTINGKTYETGAKLTVDSKNNWTQVSSWG
jgi:hypothetical protein